MRKVTLSLFLLILSTQSKAMKINYTIDIQNPNTHYALVKLEISEIKESRLLLKMPVWTPGSYMVREFERNIEQVSAISNKKNTNPAIMLGIILEISTGTMVKVAFDAGSIMVSSKMPSPLKIKKMIALITAELRAANKIAPMICLNVNFMIYFELMFVYNCPIFPS